MRTSPALIALLLAFCAVPAVAAPRSPRFAPALPPVVIHDAGGISLAPYLESEPPEGTPPSPHPLPATRAPMPGLSPYPVVSRRGAPGRLLQNPTRGRIQGGPGRPFFIVGDDAPSHEWLRINAEQLRKMSAYGMVTSVQTAERLRLMVDSLQIPMAPISADSLFEALGFAVWPVLVGADGSISQ